MCVQGLVSPELVFQKLLTSSCGSVLGAADLLDTFPTVSLHRACSPTFEGKTAHACCGLRIFSIFKSDLPIIMKSRSGSGLQTFVGCF